MKKPLHTATADRLRQMIFSGEEFGDEDRLPTEPVLASSLGVSRTTLREALKLLEGEGIIDRRHGLGTFIRTRRPSINLNISMPRSLTSLIEALNFIPGTKNMKVSTETVFPDDVERMNLSPGAEVVRIERIRTANGQPVAYTIDVIPYWAATRYPQWDGKSNFSLIDHLTYKCGIHFTDSQSSLTPLHNIRSVADRLEIEPSSHIFFFEGVSRTDEGNPVLFSREYFAPWIFRFSVERNSH